MEDTEISWKFLEWLGDTRLTLAEKSQMNDRWRQVGYDIQSSFTVQQLLLENEWQDGQIHYNISDKFYQDPNDKAFWSSRALGWTDGGPASTFATPGRWD